MMQKTRGVAALSALALVATAGMASGQNSDWTNSAGGLWSLGSNWDAGVPVAGGTATIGVAGAYQVDMDVNPSLFELRVTNPTAILDVDPGRAITITGPSITNLGLIDLNSTGSSFNARLIIDTDSTISGGGVLRMRTAFDNSQINTTNGATLTNASDHEIAGAGDINAALNNQGIVAADTSATVSGNMMRLVSENKLNSGDMLGRVNSFLNVNGIDIVQSSTGRVLADAGTVTFATGSGLQGGMAGGINGGNFQLAGGAVDFSDVTLIGIWQIAPNTTMQVDAAGITNDGVADMNNTGSGFNSVLLATQSTAIDGSGEIRMRTSADNTQINTAMDAVLAHASGHTIRGVGQINADLINNGEIWADAAVSVSGATLDFRTNDKVNNNVVGARTGTTLNLIQIGLDQTGGGSLVADGGTISTNAATINGGTIEAINGGLFQTITGSTAFQNGVEISGDWRVSLNTAVTVDENGLVNNGVGQFNPTGSGFNSVITFADATLSGTGEMQLRTSVDNTQVNTEPGAILVHGAEHTIRGVGDFNAAVINNGQITADVGVSVSGNNLRLMTNDKANNADIGITSGSFLDIAGITLMQSPSGTITNTDGTLRMQANSRLQGGAYNSSSGGLMDFTQAVEMSDVELNGNTRINAGSIVSVDAAGFTNNGVMSVNPTGSGTDSVIRITESATIEGSGMVVLRTQLENARIETDPGAVVTLGADQSVLGVGQITGEMINNGSITADVSVAVSGNIFRLSANTNTNNSTIDVVDATVLDILGTTIDQSGGGVLRAADSGQIQIRESRIIDGQITDFGSGIAGTYRINGVNVVFEDVEIDLDGTIDAGRTLEVEGNALTNNGTMSINPTGSGSDGVLLFNNSANLDGSGTILLQTLRDNAQVNSAPGAVITMGADQTIRGVGRVAAEIVNNGNIIADSSVSISGAIMDVIGPLKINNNAFTVESATTLDIETTTVDQTGGGEIRVASGGTLTLNTMTLLGGSITEKAPGDAGEYVINGVGVLFENVVLDIGGRVDPGRTLAVTGASLVNNGLMGVNPTGSSADGVVFFNEDATLTGTGEINLFTADENSRISGAEGVVIRNDELHTVSGAGRVTTGFVNDGIVAPGNGTTRELDFAGGFTQSATGQFICELGSTGDELNVTGDAVLGGTISADAIADFDFVVGRSYDVVTADAVVGEFDNFVIGQQGSVVTRIVYEPTRVRIVTTCIADANLDGTVNGTDFGAWLGAFNAGSLVADCNLDGVVNGIDFGAWLGAFNTACP